MSEGSDVLWIGPVVGPETVAQWTALSPAANRWQRGFITALRADGTNVEVLGHIPEPMWPRGALRVPAGEEQLSCGSQSRTVPYWNVPGARAWALKRAYLHRAHVLFQGRRPAAVITYNITAATHAVGILARRHDIPWIAVIADAPVGQRTRQVHDRLARDASGRVYLSWSSYQTGDSPRIHLDGGVERIRHAGEDDGMFDRRLIVYAGSVAKYAGVKLLVDAFRHCGPDRRLWICGKGGDPDVARALAEDARITRLGFVTDDELEQISRRAAVFVNPRGSIGNDGNFPSKVLEYLAYLRPVVSTWTPGLSPEYRDVLVCCADETPAALAAAIEKALHWDAAQRKTYAMTVEKFLTETRSWTHQIRRFREWLTRDVIRNSGARERPLHDSYALELE